MKVEVFLHTFARRAEIVPTGGPSSGAAAPATRAAKPNPLWSQLVTAPRSLLQRDGENKSGSPKAPATHLAGAEGLANFEANEPYSIHDFQPSTHNGFFDGLYTSSQFLASVRVKFIPVGSSKEDWGPGQKEDPVWSKDGSEFKAWKKDFQKAVADKWNSQGYQLYCTRPGWERLFAQVKVAVIDFDDNATTQAGFPKDEQAKPHFVTQVVKIPPGRKYQSETNSPNEALGRPRGTQILSSEDNKPSSDGKGHSQRVGVHESGHYLGLGDSYEDGIKHTKKVSHADQSQKALGADVPIRDDARLMSRGEKMDLSDAVTFLEAIRAATKMQEWSLQPVFRPPPPDPNRFNDGVPPAKVMA